MKRSPSVPSSRPLGPSVRGHRSASSKAARPRLVDVAAAAGVGPATVDRVLHRRHGVRETTARRVVEAARALGYVDDVDAALVPAAPLRVVFLLPVGENRYIRLLADTVSFAAQHWAPFNVRCRVVAIDTFNPHALSTMLMRHGPRSDGVVTMALDDPSVRDAIAALAARGVPVVTVITDLAASARAAFIGLDNRAAGRTAAFLLGRFIGRHPADVALIAGSRSYSAHREREAGFLSLLADQARPLVVVGHHEGHDDPERNRRLTRDLLHRHPQLAGIYNLGGASDGIARALHEAGLRHRVVLIGHGLTPDTRALLIDGTMDAVITQSPQTMVLNCVRVFANLRERRDPLSGIEPVHTQVLFRENLP